MTTRKELTEQWPDLGIRSKDIVVLIEHGMLQESFLVPKGYHVLVADVDSAVQCRGCGRLFINQSSADWDSIANTYYCVKCAFKYAVDKGVQLIASGYEWICPSCQAENTIGAVPADRTITCPRCSKNFDIENFGHAIG